MFKPIRKLLLGGLLLFGTAFHLPLHGQLLSAFHPAEKQQNDNHHLLILPGILPEKEKSEIYKSTSQGIINVTVIGKVTSDTGEPLIGVSVVLKGTTTGTSTDDSGNYSLHVPENGGTLVFSYIGFTTKEVVVGNATTLHVTLSPDAKALEEVVVIGYGTQKRLNVTGSVVSANIEAVRNAPNTNIGQSLQGTVPGLNVGPVTSAGSTPSISVRGRNTISGSSNVLIILDGVQYNNALSSINPDDIASIDLLKDASATAVYGAQAANGVLLITSRRGTADAKPRINFSTSYAIQTPSGNIRPLNRQEYLNQKRDLYWDEAYLAPDYTQPNPAFNLGTRVDPLMREGTEVVPTNFDWYEAATNKGFINDNQLSVSGATDRINYLISGSYTNQKGYIINDLFKRKTLRVNLESKATNWLTLGVQSFGSFVNQDGAEPTLSNILRLSPLLTPYRENGELNPFPFNTIDPNPFLTYDVTDFERHSYVFANIYTDITIPFIKGLSYRINYGHNSRTDRRFYASKYGGGLTGEAYKTNENYYDYTFDNIVTYNRIYKNHEVSATMLYGAVERRNEVSTSTGVGFSRLTLGYNDLSQATTQRTSSGGFKETLNYQMARLNYNFANKYLLTGTIRRDGFSAFAANHKYAMFPSLSAGWIISEESFIKGLSFVEFLKFRAGYGISGNQTSRYFSLDRVQTQAAYVFGDGGTTVFGQNVGSLPNPDLRWEKTSEINLGLDFTLLSGKLSGTAEYYTRRTNDLLFTVQIPIITGYNSINTNVGEIGNKGFELSLNSKNIDSKNLSWNTTFNLAANRSEIYELLGSGDLVASNLFIGQRLGSIYNYSVNGIYQIRDQNDGAIPAGYAVGTYKIVDYNGDGVINTNDRHILGTTEPAYRFSILNALQYKGFAFSFLLNSIQGGKDGYLAANSPSLGRSDVTIRQSGIAGINYWTPANPGGEFALYTGAAPTLNPGRYFSRSFVRLQDLTLSYKVASELMKNAGVENLSLFVSGKNVKTWTKWRGWDPETNDGGLIVNGRPLLIGYAAGMNLTF